MADALERALELVGRYDEEIRRLLPEGAEIFDAHLHLGNDIDGMVGDYDQLEQLMRDNGISRAFMFCLDEPDRHPAFSAGERPHARVRGSVGGAPHPVRPARPERDADRGGEPLPRRRRARDQAAPARAGLRLDRRAARAGVRARGRAARADPDPRRPRAAADRGRARARSSTATPRRTLIIAHAGIADMAHLAEAMAGRKGVVFDTSTWSPIDLLDFYRQVPPEQVVYASDYPVRPVHLVALHRAAHGDPRRLRRARSCG